MLILLDNVKGKMVRFRNWLKKLRQKHPTVFDWFSKFGSYLFSVLSSFLPVLISIPWVTVVLFLIVSSSLFAFQWATLVNREERHINHIHKKYKSRIRELDKAHRNEMTQKNHQIYMITSFSHSVSHTVKELTSKATNSTNRDYLFDFFDFLTESCNMLEDVLSSVYQKPIRVSVKLSCSDSSFKTYARGEQNVESRGGPAKDQNTFVKEIPITSNYAYHLLYDAQWPYYASGNLKSLEKASREKEGDQFYCEYGEKWSDLFNSTIIMPIRTKRYNDSSPGKKYMIYGLVCIDCIECISEWSTPSLSGTIGYQIIADYADSICTLAKRYSEG